MRPRDDDDSTGKHRSRDARSTTALAWVSLAIGVCIGFVLVERLYLRSQEAKLQPLHSSRLGSTLTTGSRVSRKVWSELFLGSSCTCTFKQLMSQRVFALNEFV